MGLIDDTKDGQRRFGTRHFGLPYAQSVISDLSNPAKPPHMLIPPQMRRQPLETAFPRGRPPTGHRPL